MLMLELLLGFTAVTVTARGGALGTEGTQKAESCQLKRESRKIKRSREGGIGMVFTS